MPNSGTLQAKSSPGQSSYKEGKVNIIKREILK